MGTLPIRDKTAITGVGWSEFSKASGVSEVKLGMDAALMACEDAGLETGELDGLVTFWGAKHGFVPDTPTPFEMVDALGMENCHYQVLDGWGGAWACGGVMAAALAVHAGICSHVLVYRAINGRSGALRPADGKARAANGPDQWLAPFGWGHGATYYGAPVTAHMAEFGTSSEDMGHLAVTLRTHARLNRKAYMRDRELTIEQHQESPWIIYPFRLFDCCLETDGAHALIVSSAKDAKHMRRTPVLISSMHGGSGVTDYATRLGRPLWQTNAELAAPKLYEGTGVTVDDIDFAQLYDPFTGVCLLHVEGFGLVPRGESGRAAREGEMRLDGRIPVNTHGGLMSESHTAGLGHVVEAAQQLRAEGVHDDYCEGDHDFNRAHCRQLREPEIGLVSGEFGETSLILKRAS